MTDAAIARKHMVECQIKTNKVTDVALIEALRDIPRERFVAKSLQGVAYVDEDLPIGGGRYLLEPMVHARLLQEAEIGVGDLVLVVGAGCGYGTAVLSRIGNTVIALESDSDLAGQAERKLVELGADTAVVTVGPLPDGYAAQAPYDVIIVEGALAEVPQCFLDQLAEGGRLVAIRRNNGGVGCAVRADKTPGGIVIRPLFDAAVPYLPGLEPAPAFEF